MHLEPIYDRKRPNKTAKSLHRHWFNPHSDRPLYYQQRVVNPFRATWFYHRRVFYCDRPNLLITDKDLSDDIANEK